MHCTFLQNKIFFLTDWLPNKRSKRMSHLEKLHGNKNSATIHTVTQIYTVLFNSNFSQLSKLVKIESFTLWNFPKFKSWQLQIGRGQKVEKRNFFCPSRDRTHDHYPVRWLNCKQTAVIFTCNLGSNPGLPAAANAAADKPLAWTCAREVARKGS